MPQLHSTSVTTAASVVTAPTVQAAATPDAPAVMEMETDEAETAELVEMPRESPSKEQHVACHGSPWSRNADTCDVECCNSRLPRDAECRNSERSKSDAGPAEPCNSDSCDAERRIPEPCDTGDACDVDRSSPTAVKSLSAPDCCHVDAVRRNDTPSASLSPDCCRVDTVRRNESPANDNCRTVVRGNESLPPDNCRRVDTVRGDESSPPDDCHTAGGCCRPSSRNNAVVTSTSGSRCSDYEAASVLTEMQQLMALAAVTRPSNVTAAAAASPATRSTRLRTANSTTVTSGIGVVSSTAAGAASGSGAGVNSAADCSLAVYSASSLSPFGSTSAQAVTGRSAPRSHI